MKNIKYITLLLVLSNLATPTNYEEIVELPSYYDWLISPIASYYKKNEILSKYLRNAALEGDINKLEHVPLSYNLPDETGNNFLHIAIQNGNIEFAQKVLNKANINEFLDLLEYKNNNGISPIDLLESKIKQLRTIITIVSKKHKQLLSKKKKLILAISKARIEHAPNDLLTDLDQEMSQINDQIQIISFQKKAIFAKIYKLKNFVNWINRRAGTHSIMIDMI